MRKAFFVEKGVDPVYQDKLNEVKVQKKKKKKWPKVVFALIILIALLIGAGYFLATNRRHVQKPTKQATIERVISPTKEQHADYNFNQKI